MVSKNYFTCTLMSVIFVMRFIDIWYIEYFGSDDGVMLVLLGGECF
jgi:hypothetical protein